MRPPLRIRIKKEKGWQLGWQRPLPMPIADCGLQITDCRLRVAFERHLPMY
jgi:hypothetical protein